MVTVTGESAEIQVEMLPKKLQKSLNCIDNKAELTLHMVVTKFGISDTSCSTGWDFFRIFFRRYLEFFLTFLKLDVIEKNINHFGVKST